MAMDNMTDSGTAISTGRKRRNSGTAIKDSPKPRVDRTKEATKLIRRICMITGVWKKSNLAFLYQDPVCPILRYGKKSNARGKNTNYIGEPISGRLIKPMDKSVAPEVAKEHRVER